MQYKKYFLKWSDSVKIAGKRSLDYSSSKLNRFHPCSFLIMVHWEMNFYSYFSEDSEHETETASLILLDYRF